MYYYIIKYIIHLVFNLHLSTYLLGVINMDMNMQAEIKARIEFLKTEFDIEVDEGLMPKIYDYDKVAEKFLIYYYKEFFYVNKMDINAILHRMGLSVIVNNRYNDRISLDFKNKNIFIGERYSNEHFCGSQLLAILHGCMHWCFHRQVYYLNSWPIECSGTFLKAEEYLSYQANALALAVAMPKSLVKPYLSTLEELKLCSFAFIKEAKNILLEMARSFNVTPNVAKTRLLNLHFYDIKGVYNFVDNKEILSYKYKNSYCLTNEKITVDIDEENFYKLCEANNEFGNLVKAGFIKYCNGHCVKNNELYIKNNKITNYARTHIDEACIIFNKELYTEYFCKAATTCGLVGYFFKYKSLTNDYDVLGQEMKFVKAKLNNLPEGAWETFNKFLDESKMTLSKLSEDSGVTQKTLSNIKNHEEDFLKIEKKTLIKICLGLRLKSYFIFSLLKKAGMELNDCDIKDLQLMELLLYADDHIQNTPNEELIDTPIEKARRYIEENKLQISL